MPAARPLNYRDVGEVLGLWLDPSPVPTGRLLRGGKLDATTNAFGDPRTIINLRRGADPCLEGVRVVHVPSADDGENYLTRRRRVRAWLAKALRAIASAEPPIYVHCTAGRDRTGVVIAATLLLVGVAPRVVVDEYMLSEGAEAALIEDAIAGVLEAREELATEATQLRAALLR